MLRLGKKHHMLEDKKTSQPHKNIPVPPIGKFERAFGIPYSITQETATRSDIFRIIEHYLSNCKKKRGNLRLARLYPCKPIKA